MLSREAIAALVELDSGARFNCLHSVSRELIAAGLAFDGWSGSLEITEAGRRIARKQGGVREVRSFVVDDPNISNMSDLNEPRFVTPVDSHPAPNLQPTAAGSRDVPGVKMDPISHRAQSENDPDAADQVDRNKPWLSEQLDIHAGRPIVWSRARAIKAAGEANGRSGIWVDEKWVACFLDAYEAVG